MQPHCEVQLMLPLSIDLLPVEMSRYQDDPGPGSDSNFQKAVRRWKRTRLAPSCLAMAEGEL